MVETVLCLYQSPGPPKEKKVDHRAPPQTDEQDTQRQPQPSGGEDDAEKAEKFISWIEELKEKMDIPQYIDPIPEKDEDQIIRWAMKEGNPIYPTPVYWGYTEFKKALRYCQGKDV